MGNETVESYNDVYKNILTLKKYLDGSDEERKYALERIKLGICFVVVQEENGHFGFYPSKFVGYKNNSLYEHQNAVGRDGRVTNIRLIKILKKQPIAVEEYDKEYKRFCAKLGINACATGAYGGQRKFWIVNS